jgi:hypothetical protein
LLGPEFDEVPKALVGTADEVAAVALAALARRRQPTIVPRTINKAFVFTSRVLTRRAMLGLVGSAVPKATLALPADSAWRTRALSRDTRQS